MDYMDDLHGIGYSAAWRKNTIEAALADYERYAQGEINRPGAKTKMSRRAMKLAGMTTWFTQKSRESGAPNGSTQLGRPRRPPNMETQVIKSACFMLHTPGSQLRSRLCCMEEGLFFRGRMRH